MATTLYLDTAVARLGFVFPQAPEATPSLGFNRLLSTSRGAGTVEGGRGGMGPGPVAGVPTIYFISAPLSAGFTLSGSVTFNLYGREATMTDNVGFHCKLYKVPGDALNTATTLVVDSEKGTELPTTNPPTTAQNWSATPTSTVFAKGDRIALLVLFNDAGGNMGSGAIAYLDWGATSGGGNGDSYVSLTETVTFASAASGTTIYPTDTASDVATASVDREAWTSRGAGVQTDATNTVAGPTAPIQVTDTAGGTVVDWFTKPLTAFTLSGIVTVNFRASGGANVTGGVELHRVDGDGTNPTLWASGKHSGLAGTATDAIAASEDAYPIDLAAADLSISAGQRLRFRVYIDDSGQSPMSSGFTVTTYYAGTTGGASGDTYLTFTQTLTEQPSLVVATTAGMLAPDSPDLQATDDPRGFLAQAA